jgi:hypothetical protein
VAYHYEVGDGDQLSVSSGSALSRARRLIRRRTGDRAVQSRGFAFVEMKDDATPTPMPPFVGLNNQLWSPGRGVQSGITFSDASAAESPPTRIVRAGS